MDATIAAVSLREGCAIVRKALEQAKNGEPKAREWLGRLLVGSDPIPLAKLTEELREELEAIRGKHPDDRQASLETGQGPAAA